MPGMLPNLAQAPDGVNEPFDRLSERSNGVRNADRTGFGGGGSAGYGIKEV